MSLFSFTGSALANLVGNTPGANVSNLVTCLNDLKTFINSGNLDATNLAVSAKPATVLGGYRTERQAAISIATGSATTYFPTQTGAALSVSGATTTVPLSLWLLNPAFQPTTPATPMLRMSTVYGVNGVAPAVNFTIQLFAITAFVTGVNNQLGVNTVSAVPGSNATITAPGAGSTNSVQSADFAIPAAGTYIAGVAPSGTQATNSFISLAIDLQMHYV